jgi:hypothetical protein
MEIIITVKEKDGTKSNHNVICTNLIEGIDDFIHDMYFEKNFVYSSKKYSYKDIRAIVIIDE